MTETAQSSNKSDWLIFLVSLVITVALLVWSPEWFWVTLPFVLTYLVKALNKM